MENDFELKEIELEELIKNRDEYKNLEKRLTEEFNCLQENGKSEPELMNIIKSLDWLINYTETSLKKELHNEEFISHNH